MVISLKMLAADSDPAGYYLTRTAGCAADYYTGPTERTRAAKHAGIWLGSGAAASGLSGELDPAGEKVLRSLLDGRAPDGRVLVAAVLRGDNRGRLPATPLVEAIRSRADQLAVPVEELLTDPKDRAPYTCLVAREERPVRRRATTLPPTLAGRLAEAAGLDPHQVHWAQGAEHPDRYATAGKFAGKRVDVRRAGMGRIGCEVGVGSPASAPSVS